MADNIELKKIDDDFAIQLLEILNNDEKLKAELEQVTMIYLKKNLLIIIINGLKVPIQKYL